MKNKHVLLPVTVFLGLAVYLILFYATRLPSLEGVTGGVFRRVYFFIWLLFPDGLLAQWCGTPPEFAVLDRIPVLAIAAVVLGSAFCLGWLVLLLFRADRGLTRLETFVFSVAVGLNLVSTYVLLMGLFGLLRNVFVFTVPAVLALGAAGWLGRQRKAGRAQSRKEARLTQSSATPSQARQTGGDWLRPGWLWLGCPFVLVILLGGMLPPIEFDVLEYHLQVPKEWFQQGRIGFLPHNVYGNMPMGTEMLSLLAMVIAGDWWLGAVAGKTVIAAFAPLTALALLAAGRRFFSPTAGIVAAVVYISAPWIIWVSTNGLVEGAYGYYLLLAVYALLVWYDNRRQEGDRAPFSPHEVRTVRSHREKGDLSPFRLSFLILAGYLAGGAVACKYPAVLFVVIPLTVWIILTHLPTQWRAVWKPLGVFLLAVVAGCGLWFGKNWAFTGNPTYPLLDEAFGDSTTTWTPEKNAQWNRVHRPHDFSPGTLARDLSRVGWRSERLSPLMMPLAVLAFFVPRNRRLWLALAVYFGFVIAAWWLLTHRLDRFWIPALPLVALLAGVGACWSGDRLWRGFLIVLLIVGAVSNLLMASSAGRAQYNRYFVSLRRARTDPARLDAWHRYFNRHAREGRVLMVGDAQVFDLEVPVLYSTCFDDTLFERLVKDPATGGLRAPGEIRVSFRGRGITHVYVHWGEIDRYRSPGNYGFTEFVQPEVFETLVREGVLDPLPDIEGHRGRAYRVGRRGSS